jgi:hypothetical protein
LALNYTDTTSEDLQDLDCGLTSHFQTYLNSHGKRLI